MSNTINLKKGLDIPIKGAAARTVRVKVVPDVVAIKPTDFKGLVPRLLVREGDKVLAGSPLFADKQNPDILFTSPVSGTVQEVVRGAKRKLLAVLVKADEKQEYVDFGAKDAASLNAESVKSLLLNSGLWPSIIQRPYGVLAGTDVKPKAIFISAFNTAPLAADTDYVLADRTADIQAGVTALSKLTDGGIHLGLNADNYSSTPFHRVEGVIQHVFSGKHPAGNVGVQISHVSPIMKGDTVWTVSPVMIAAIGRLINTGKLDLSRKVAVTGPAAKEPAYVEAFPGMPAAAIAEAFGIGAKTRVISGDVLSGENIGADGYLGFYDNQVTLIEEGDKKELLGWANPIRSHLFSSSPCYFSWLTPGKKYDMDTNLHGGVRAFVETKCFEDVTPMEIFPIYLIKACLAGDIDKMEQFGIYEVLPEDLALCDYVDPSKNEIQYIISKGIDQMIKEMA
ncbi:MAG: Na(+)-translocating NADH-quinone reductase subunit A [Bacteroidales bacterium]|nr:Na(+)-translocating NADH-quinone reductase subunit A [Bacteroidales bacterium]